MTKKYFSPQQLSLFQYRDLKIRELPEEELYEPPVILKNDISQLDIENCLPKIWRSLALEYFPDAPWLHEYKVNWSNRRQIRTLASCSLERKRIRVARELKEDRYYQWLSPLLYHEMCHAYLGFSIHNKMGRTAWHGPEFKALEARHPLMVTFNKWVHEGGWAKAVRRERAISAHQKRKKKASFGS